MAVASFSYCSPLHAQVGDNNPAGHSGIFNGQINTGCSYDPYTGNATRSITDIAVAGAVGEYPLALVRTANSRTPSTTEVFGFAGGWNHNYNWILEDSPASTSVQPKRYTVDFPDGRVEAFRAVTWDSYYRVRPGADTPAQSTSAGMRERFMPLSNGFCYVVLPDGGKVKFSATQHSFQDNGATYYYYTYRALAIIDPYGLTTTFTFETVNGRVRLLKVTEPAGRYLQFSYVGNGPRISQVQEFIGGVGRRTVNYYYINCNSCWLDRVRYYDNPAWDARYQYCNSNIGGELPPLLWTCDDPMYAGPMHKIAYVYRTTDNYPGNHAVYGQISSENYYDGTNVRAAVSTLTVPSATTRTETRGDSEARTFIYNGTGFVIWVPDFMSHSAQQHYDATTKYVDYMVDRKGHRTDYTTNALTGNVTVVTFPLTQGDTPGQQTQPTLRYQYGWANCPDQKNRDANNPYYLYSVTDEGGHATIFTRDTNKRVARIDYADGSYETFSYNGFGQVLTHRMTTGGTETFLYDGSNRRQYYSDPYHNNANNPSFQYYYNGLDRLSGVVDALNHSTNFDYNDRGQVTVTTLPWIDGQRYTITNAYNANGDGTLVSVTDQLGHVTSYTYDDYRRLKSVTPPVRGAGDNGAYVTSFYYGANPWDGLSDYNLTDSNVTFVTLPSGKKTQATYDGNRRKQTVTVGYGTSDAATTSYGYDNVGNLTSVAYPLNHGNITAVYDERNRPSSISVLSQTTSFTYDTAGRKKTISRPNGQIITNVSFDEMNRVLQQNATQTPGPTAVTKYSYYGPGEVGAGLLKTMQDPHLYGLNPPDQYTYEYDTMGRKKKLTYPLNSANIHTNEQWNYDNAGRVDTFTNRAGKTQTFTYDQLSRMAGFSWNDNGTTPSVSFGYDTVSRLTSINNANANVTRAYYNDNLLRSETEQILLTGGRSKAVSYTYDADGNRASTTYPNPAPYIFNYTYTGRNQLKTVDGWATYAYDPRGNLTTRTLIPNGTSTDYQSYDTYDRVQWVVHHFANGVNRSFNYDYDDQSNNRLYTARYPANVGEVFSYDFADQVSGLQLNIADPQNAPPPSQTIFYDPNGNRTTFRPYGPTDTYVTNNLNQYASRNSNNAVYEATGNLTQSPDPAGSRLTCSYDAQNRLLSATKNGTTVTLKYDGLNRQISRDVTGQPRTFNVWDGWDLIEEYQVANNGAMTAGYVYGADGLILDTQVQNADFNWYYRDGSGDTSQVADSDGTLLEWYRYDLQGTPIVNDQPTNHASAYGVRHLFTGQQWYSDISLYDLRNRFYSPDIGRFVQPDPIGFGGDATNLYRYCGNNPVTYGDPTGEYPVYKAAGGYWYYIVNPGYQTGQFVPGSRGWCAWGMQILAGGMPDTKYWVRGAPLSSATPIGAIVAMRWIDGHYPQMSPQEFLEKYGKPLYHTGAFLFFDGDDAVILDQWNTDKSSKPLGESKYSPDGWYEVNVPKDKGPYGSGGAKGQGAGGDSPGWSPFGQWMGLEVYVPNLMNYTGPGPTTLSNRFGSWGPSYGGPIGNWIGPNGQIISTSIFGPGNYYSGLDPNAAFGHIYEGNPIGAGEGGRVPKEWR